jgi:hypothetical protein
MRIIVSLGFWAVLLHNLYVFSVMNADPSMVSLQRYAGVPAVLRRCDSTSSTSFPVLAPTSYPAVVEEPDPTCRNHSWPEETCYHTQFPAFNTLTQRYQCTVSAQFESITFDQVTSILTNPTYIYDKATHIRGTDSCYWSHQRQNCLRFHLVFFLMILLDTIYRTWCGTKL